MQRKISKYQQGGVITSPDSTIDANLANNQQQVIEGNDPFEQLDAALGFEGLDSVDKTMEQDSFKLLDEKLGIEGEDLDTTQQEQQPQPTQQTTPEDEQRIKDLNDLYRTGDIRLNSSKIKPEDIKIVSGEGVKSVGNRTFGPKVKIAYLPTGDYIAFTPSDDYTFDQAVESTIGAIVAGGVGGTIGSVEVLGNIAKKILIKTGFVDEQEESAQEKAGGIFYTPWAKEVKKQIRYNDVNAAKTDSEIQDILEIEREAEIYRYAEAKKLMANDERITEEEAMKIVQDLHPPGLIFDSKYWRHVASPSFYSEEVLQGLESAAEFAVPGIGVGKLALFGKATKALTTTGTIAKMDRFSKVVRGTGQIADVFAAGFTMGALESAFEGDHNAASIAVEEYNRTLPEGEFIGSIEELEKEPESEAKQKALETYQTSYDNIFNANLIPLSILNTIPAAQLLGAGKLLGKIPGRLGTLGRKYPLGLALPVGTTVGAIGEGLQETYQTGVENFEKDKVLNGLNEDSDTWGDMVGGGLRGLKDLGREVGTTDSFLLGMFIGGGTSIGPSIVEAFEQRRGNKKINELLKAYPESDFTTLRDAFKNGKPDIDVIAGKINNLNRAVINEEFIEAAQRMNNPELMDYAYQQVLSGLTYDALKSGVNTATVKDHVSKLMNNYIDKSVTHEENDGSVVSPEEFISRRINEVDTLSNIYNNVNQLAKKHDLPEISKRRLFDAKVGAVFFNDLSKRLFTELSETNAEINKRKEAKKHLTEDPEVRVDVSDALDLELNDKKKTLTNKYNSAVEVALKYVTTANNLLKKDNVKAAKEAGKEQKIESIFKEATSSSKTVEEIRERVTKKLQEEGVKVPKEEIDQKTKELRLEEVKNREKDLRVEIATAARRDGVSANELSNPSNTKIEPWESDIRKKLVEEELRLQAKEAEDLPRSERYIGRPLLLEHEAKQVLEDIPQEELNVINARFLAIKKVSIDGASAFANFFNAPINDRLKDNDYRKAIAEYLSSLEDVAATAPKLPITDNFFDAPTPDAGDSDSKSKPKKEPAPTIDREAKMIQESVTVYHKKLEGTGLDNESSKTVYTTTKDEHDLGLAYLHMGLIKPGDTIYLEVDPELKNNKNRGQINWDNVTIQVVAYDKNGERVVIGALKKYHSKYHNSELTKTIRRDIFKNWENHMNSGSTSVFKSGWETSVEEIYKAHVDKLKYKDITSMPNTNEVLSLIGLTYDGVEVGLTTGIHENQKKYSTNGASYTLEQDRKTKDEDTRTGFPVLLIKSQKSTDDKYHESIPLFTKLVQDVQGYKEAIVKAINENNQAVVQLMVRSKDKTGKIFGPTWKMNNGIPYVTIGDTIYEGGEAIYNALQLGTKPVHIDFEWLENYSTQDEIQHPVFGFMDVKKIIINHLTKTDIDPKGVNHYTYKGQTKDSFFHSSKISVKPWTKLTKGEKIKDVTASTTTTTPSTPSPTSTTIDPRVVDIENQRSESLALIQVAPRQGFDDTADWYISNIPSPKYPDSMIGAWDRATLEKKINDIYDAKLAALKETLSTSSTEFPTEDLDLDIEIDFDARLTNTIPDIVYEDSNEAAKWIKKRLAEIDIIVSDDAIAKFHKLLGLKDSVVLWGIARDAAITLSEKSKKGTGKHEAIHVIMNLFLTSKQRQAVFNELYEIHKDDPKIAKYSKEDLKNALLAIESKRNTLGKASSDDILIGEEENVKYGYKNIDDKWYSYLGDTIDYSKEYTLNEIEASEKRAFPDSKRSASEFYSEGGILTLLEEKMADTMAEYTLEGIAPKWLKKASPKLAKILDDLYKFLFREYDILQQYFTDEKTVGDIYRQLENNSFGRNFFGQRRKSYQEIFNKNITKRIESNKDHINARITSIPQEKIIQRISNINRDIINKIMTEDKEFRGPNDEILSVYDYLYNKDATKTTERLVKLYSAVKKELLKREASFRAIAATKTELTDKQREAYIKNADAIKNVEGLISIGYIEGIKDDLGTEAYDFTRRLLRDLTDSQGTVMNGQILVTNEQLEKLKEEHDGESEFEDESPRQEDSVSDSLPLDSQERWQQDVITQNSYDRISPRLKKVFSGIPQQEEKVDPKTGEKRMVESKDDWGYKIYHNPRAMMDLLVENLASMENINEMLIKLEELKNGKDYRLTSVVGVILTDDKLINDTWIGIANKYKVPHFLNKVTKGSEDSFDKITIFNTHQQGVVAAISAAFYTNFNIKNWNLDTNTPKSTIGDLTYGQVRAMLDDAKPENRKANLPILLSNLGFTISDRTKQALLELPENIVDDTLTLVKSIVLQMEQGINPTEFGEDGIGGAKGWINGISKILRNSDDRLDLKMATNGKNKLISGHVQAGYAIKLFNRIKTKILENKNKTNRDSHVTRFTEETDYLFKQDAPIVKWIRDRIQINMSFGFFDSRKQNEDEEGQELIEMSPRDMLINQFEFWLAGLTDHVSGKQKKGYDWASRIFKTSWYNVPIPDSPSSYFLRAPVFEKIADIFTQLHDVWLQEYNRIQYVKENPTGNTNMDVNGENYQFFPYMPKDVSTWEEARAHIEAWLESEYQAYIDELIDNKLIERYGEQNKIFPKSDFPSVYTTKALGNVSFEDTLRMFWYNDFLMSTQIITLLSGDPAFYKKNKTDDLVSGDFQKRGGKQVHASGLYPNFENETFKVQYIKDIKVTSEEDFIENIRNMISQYYTGDVLEAILNVYRSEFSLTDAQGYITLDRWRDIKKGLSEWTPKHDELYETLKAGKTASATDMLLVTQPLKPQSFGFVGKGKMSVPTQHKYSAVVLHEDLVKDNPTLKAIYERMTDPKNPIDELITSEGVKVGASEVITLEEYLAGKDTTQVVPNSIYKKQQEVPEHFLDSNNSNLLGIQLRKLIGVDYDPLATYSNDPYMLAVYEQVFGTKVDKLLGQDVLKLIDWLQSRNIQEDRIKLNSELSNFTKFRNMLMDAIFSKGLGSSFTDILELKDADTFRLPIAFPLISRGIEQIINSFFKKVSKQKHNGGSYVNVSGLGFLNEHNKDLKIVINDDGTYYVEVALPKNAKLVGFNMESNEIEKLQMGVVYRIPTEGKYSMFPIKVVKWLEPSVGGIIAMPKEVTAIAGLDFDIDKVYSMMYNYKVTGKNKIVVSKSFAEREGRENLMLDLYRNILQHKNTFKDFINAQSIQPLRDIEAKLNKPKTQYPIALLRSRIKFVYRNMVGKNLIGIFATNNSFHALAVGSGAQISEDALNKLLQGSLAKYRGILTGHIDKANDINGDPISRAFAMLLSASVDNAKEPILEGLNVNGFTAPMLSLMLHLGIPLEDAVMRLNDEDMLEESKSNASGIVSSDSINNDNIRNLYDTSKSLGRVISALRVDSGSGPTLHEIDKKIQDIQYTISAKVINVGRLFPTIGRVDGKYEIIDTNGSPLATQEYIKVFLDEANFAAKHFPYFNDDFIDVKTELSKYKGDRSVMTASNRRTADIEHMAILHYKLFNIKDPVDLIKNFPARFVTFKAGYKSTKYADLFNAFILNQTTKTITLFDKNQFDAQMQEKVKEQWDGALHDDSIAYREKIEHEDGTITERDVTISELANDLIKYGFLISGYTYTRNSYLHMAPPSYFEDTPGFAEFTNVKIPTSLIAFNIAINQPGKFLPRMGKSFMPTGDNLKKLVRATEKIDGQETKYYLPMYTKKDDKGNWIIFLNKEFVQNNFQSPDKMTSPQYTQILFRDETIKGRAYNFNFDVLTSLGFRREIVNNVPVEVPKEIVAYTAEDLDAKIRNIHPDLDLPTPCK